MLSMPAGGESYVPGEWGGASVPDQVVPARFDNRRIRTVARTEPDGQQGIRKRRYLSWVVCPKLDQNAGANNGWLAASRLGDRSWFERASPSAYPGWRSPWLRLAHNRLSNRL